MRFYNQNVEQNDVFKTSFCILYIENATRSDIAQLIAHLK